MSVPPGTRFGPYETGALIGAGGMGEVYRARDTRLNRDVALKVLPAGAASAERLARFEQEARAAAALAHPDILAVYDVGSANGSPFIVSELLEGTTLDERLRDGALPLRKAIDAAIHIARGLAAAHARDIVHRDLKPANVFLTTDGRPKILDFGLAKLSPSVDATLSVAGATALPTTPPGTTPGMVLGTVGYMAPEQVRGLAVDRRADIFAFGVLLYEMVTGTRAFQRDTPPETMTAILKDEPADAPLTTSHVPPAVARIIRRCLEKNPALRFQTADDLAFALESIEGSGSSILAAPAGVPPSRWRERVLWASALAVCAAGGTWLALSRAPDERPAPLPLVLDIAMPEGVELDVRRAPISISPDGRSIAFLGNDLQDASLWVRSLDSLTLRRITSVTAPSAVFWSPDSRDLGVVDGTTLKRVPAAGGPATTICADCPSNGGTWGADGTILFGRGGAIVRVPAGGGTPTVALDVTQAARPRFLPDGRRFLFLMLPPGGGDRELRLGTIGSTEHSLVRTIETNSFAYSEGYLLWVRGDTLLAQRFDADAGTLSGEPETVTANIGRSTLLGGGSTGLFDAALNAPVIAYAPGAQPSHRLTWFERSGGVGRPMGETGAYQSVVLSQDGRYASVSLVDTERRSRDVWTFDTTRGLPTRLTHEPGEERSAVFSPDGSRLVFNSFRAASGGLDLFIRPRGGGAEEPLVTDGISKDPSDWSPDGRFVVFRATGPTATNDLWIVPVTGTGRTPRPLIVSPFDENSARVSPDSRWVAYASDESGNAEVYVSGFPDGAGKSRVSAAGGTLPLWNGNGRELFYLAPDHSIIAVPVTTAGKTFEAGAGQPLFRFDAPLQPGNLYAVTPDGQRFLTIVDHSPPLPITVTVNWPGLIGR